MADGARLASAVMFVRDLDRSVRFYAELLGLDIADRSPTAALLVSPAGAHLILRAMGRSAMHVLGGTGVQYVAWVVSTAADLARCEEVLKAHSAYSQTRGEDGVSTVEGRDPDGVVVLLQYPGPEDVPLRDLHLCTRIYAW